ncbi:hypothetical protein Glove_21g189 [Diversispora epigaea]|uniref:Protein kinase domain-containing protein n=1 Tax=Diversispora epigaea TaxID=1348612 RepID=A0A397JV17_9GLOM|nr:hypothetical protein Glove_21g189 [Diversispora epigaea]
MLIFNSIKASCYELIGQNLENPNKRSIAGVLPYIAPEVLCGEEYTKAANEYSFGIVAYELITVTHRPTFENLWKVFNKYYKDCKENGFKNNYPLAIYTCRLLNFSSLPKLKNNENFEKELKEITESI